MGEGGVGVIVRAIAKRFQGSGPAITMSGRSTRSGTALMREQQLRDEVDRPEQPGRDRYDDRGGRQPFPARPLVLDEVDRDIGRGG